jgi:CelD/BcsL family acetyltransferase involved in cellulose biosynthesis
LDVRIVSDRAEFAALAPHWDELTARSEVHPFQLFAWSQAWMNTIGTTDGRQPHVVTLREDGRLVGVMALNLRRYKGVRLLEWIGSRVTDYCDVLLDPAVERSRAMQQIADSLRRAGGYDVLRLGQVALDAKVRPLIDMLNPWVETQEQAYALPITWSDSESWLLAQSAKSRARVRRGMRALEQLGLRFHIWQPDEPLGPAVDAVIQQKLAWIAARQVDSFLIEPGGTEFVRQLAQRLGPTGSLHLSTLQSADGYVATHFGFYRNRRLYYYMPTYDAGWIQQRVGTMLLDQLMRWSCDQGAQCFDMLRGAHEYKSSYGVQPTELQTLVSGRSLLGKAAVMYYRRKQAGKAQHAQETAASSPPPAAAGEGADNG